LLTNFVFELKSIRASLNRGFESRLHKAQQYRLFDAFAVATLAQLPSPVAVDGVTIVSQDGQAIKKMHALLAPVLAETSTLKDRPLRQLCIMDREEEFSVNPRSDTSAQPKMPFSTTVSTACIELQKFSILSVSLIS
jgi:hypothetical protein